MNAAAIILCAGKGTRMNDGSKNKVCFDCAGIPTIKRIVANMKTAGVTSFVIVIGHQAYSVMDCLDGEDGIIYAYQKEQNGTGHAALCGLKALKSVGFDGPTIISMGDKIISSDVISDLLTKASYAKGVFGVQPLMNNFNGGRVTHVFRVSARIGLSVGAKTPRATELQLEKYIPSHLLPKAHHWLILHGRYTCIARKPKCEQCGISAWCKYFQSKSRKE